MFDDFGECFHFTSYHAQSARHRFYWFQWSDKLADPVRCARDDENIEERVEFTYFRRGHAAGEDGRLGQPAGGGMALQGGPFWSVADDQRPGRHAAAAHDRDGLEQRSDALVRAQRRHHAGHVLARADAELLAEGAG